VVGAQHERPGVAHHAGGDPDQSVLQGFDHGFAAREAETAQWVGPLGCGLIRFGGGVPGCVMAGEV